MMVFPGLGMAIWGEAFLAVAETYPTGYRFLGGMGGNDPDEGADVSGRAPVIFAEMMAASK
jgi:hypothetical protein